MSGYKPPNDADIWQRMSDAKERRQRMMAAPQKTDWSVVSVVLMLLGAALVYWAARR